MKQLHPVVIALVALFALALQPRVPANNFAGPTAEEHNPRDDRHQQAPIHLEASASSTRN
jgi:hypothetical protein